MRNRRITILVFLVINLIMAAYYGRKILLYSLLFWGILFMIAILYYSLLPNDLPIHLELPASCQKGKEIAGYLHVEQNGRIPIFYGLANIHFKSFYYQQEDDLSMEIVLMGREEGIAAFDMDLPYLGMYEVTMEEAEIYGLLGMLKKTIPTSLKKTIMVMPNTRDIRVNPVEVGSLDPEGEEIREAVYGYDPGMYQGIRPYRQGDSMKHIHWKLTSKTDEMMVKELGIPAGREPRLYLETGLPDLNPERIDSLIEDYFSLSMALLKQGQTHILCWKSNGQTAHEYSIYNMTMLEEVLEPLYHLEFWQDTGRRQLDTWIYYMNFDESLVYGLYRDGDQDYLELMNTGLRLWNGQTQ